ncbi:DUF302 domain-containing protein [Stygiolobus caldivivus]|uniref:DUF302 domain-containing protein n=1 Tax=Stygiolobus caldivivus TaxID=2824673 RepID=A0A8D5ZEB2_9CREN|nr:DUF302 domain-containing protein [Stygiolobus caldivivus]BCU69568.1 hypothetical protein KN1_08650 [Stygiolobus caldivivus]
MHRVECKDSFENCEKKLINNISGLGMTIFCVIDHQKNAQDVNLNLGRTKLITFGNPSAGTVLMQKDREIGYDLPLRVLAWEDEGKVFLTYKMPSEIAKEYNISDEVLKKMDAVFNKLIESVIG